MSILSYEKKKQIIKKSKKHKKIYSGINIYTQEFIYP